MRGLMDRFGRRDFRMPGGRKPALWSSLALLFTVHAMFACSPVHIKTRNGVYHTVRKGETLWRICDVYQANQTSVCLFNRISDPENIRTGQKLFIPGADSLRTVPRVTARAAEGGQGNAGTSSPPRAGSRSPPVVTRKLGFIWPVKGRLTSRFGIRDGQQHDGIDIAAPRGTPVHAAEGGKVVYSNNGIKGYGNLIIIQHRNDFSTVYAHNSRNIVSVDAPVKKGQTIGYVGNTGRSRGNHLHFEIRRRVKPINPLKYLPPPAQGGT